MPLHWLVHIHRVEAGHVKAGEPHIANNRDFQRVVRVFEAVCQTLTPGFSASDMPLPLDGIGGRSRHYNFQAALIVILVMPVGVEFGEGVVQIHANSAAHAHDHGLAVHRFKPFSKMINDVLGD